MIERLPVGYRHELNEVLEVKDNLMYLVRCTGCGLERDIWHYNVLRQRGCRKCAHRLLDRPAVKDPVTGKVSKEYLAWTNMRVRCGLVQPSYGDRLAGTRYENMEIEPSWLGPDGFANFYKDVGPAPGVDWGTKFYLDRKDNNLGYVKGNVRWVLVTESNQNKSNTRLLTAFGVTRPLEEWANDLGCTSTAISSRIKAGWSVEDSVSIRPQGPRPTNDEYYLAIAIQVARRSTCLRRAVGCVLVDNNYYVSATAYNAQPARHTHCLDSPCVGANAGSGTERRLCEARCAEELALIRCKDIHAIYACYTTTAPCEECVRRLLDTSCQRIIFIDDYPHKEAMGLWLHAGREWIQLEPDEDVLL